MVRIFFDLAMSFPSFRCSIAGVLLSVLPTLLNAADEPPSRPEPQPKPEPAPAKPAAVEAAKAPEKPSPVVPEKKAEEAAKKKTVAEVTKDHQRLAGLFDFFYQPEKGKLLLYLRKQQLNQEFIYHPQTLDGVVQAGFMRGQYGSEAVIRWLRAYDRIELVEVPVAFHFEPGHPLARAAAANTSPAVLASETILAEDEGGFVIDATQLFFRETLLRVHRGSDPGKSVLGRLSETKTRLVRANTYPDNVLVNVAFVYENPSPAPSSSAQQAEEIADPRFITLQIQHALVRMPENDFKPRLDDPRVGYFATQVTDMTSSEVTPYRDVIHRWHLVKQKPGAALSEPVEPITFWIENTTPVEFRDTIRKAALSWNKAFETAGFKEAVVVKVQPDKAAWDAGDIHYNVLRWTSSPNPPFGGYGPSFVNPRTGQILGADIMLEYSYMAGRVRTAGLFEEVGLAGMPMHDPGQKDFTGLHRRHGAECLAGVCAGQGLRFGRSVLRAAPAGRLEMDRLMREALHYLVLHEIGHTLGLNHNFRGSQLHAPAALQDAKRTAKTGLMGSVMDYPSANLAPLGGKQGQYYITQPGPYDHWAIEFGYSEALEDPEAEAERLAAIASRSHQPELGFANDADDMRAPGKGIDPRAMLFDLSSDPVRYGAARCELARSRIASLLERKPENGEDWQSLVEDYAVLTREIGDALSVATRFVGGVMVERAHSGQAPEKKPFTPVDKATQSAALDMLAEHGFAPSAWQVPAELAAHLQTRRRGFNHEQGEDPRFHERVSRIQRGLLDHLLHSAVLTRLSDSALYGNEMTVGEVLSRLTEAIFTGDPETGPTTLRQTLQAMYLERLLALANNGQTVSATQAAALFEVEQVRKRLQEGLFANGAPAHSHLLLYKIRRALDESKA